MHFVISEILSTLTTCKGEGGGGEKEGTGVKWASHYYIYFIMLADFHHLFLF